MPPAPTPCDTCGRVLAPGELYYRFTLVLEGEQDVLGTLPRAGALDDTGDELAALLRRLEDGPESAQELEEQVHWERHGRVCKDCRALVVRTLSTPPEPAGPH